MADWRPLQAEHRSNRVAPALIETAKFASSVRNWICAGPETSSKLLPEALEGMPEALLGGGG
eukprot:4997884-Alexandrium_andersonii.AAC.1